MSRPHIPPPRIDLATLPPLLSTGDPNSFAQFTFKVRDPRILQDLEDAPWFSPDLKHAFKKFRLEILESVIQPLREDAPDTEFWQTISKPYIGRSWFDVPWYWAETFFYRRILEIVGYFQMGAWHERDPFAPQKDAELEPEAAPKRVSQLLQSLPKDPTLHFERMLSAAMWGNRVDLSYNVERTVGRAERLEDERANLLVDDAVRVWNLFSSGKIKRLVYIADNAGTELALDLALIDWLFEIHRIEKVTLHLKPQPFYVSDAMPQDVEHTLAAFERANDDTRAIAKRLRARLASDQFELRVHWFYPTPLHYFQAPDDLFALFRAADFIILKGDVNYRRVVGDAHWKPTIAFEYTTRYFPTPFVNLRTMKSDVIVGLPPGKAEELTQVDREWRVNGKRGVIQANLESVQK
ncbi:MAG TPA: damage-control phosphatase ARMT1 family protein [Anaerolineae bacterium]|nr:damage-control phosphatase ARMT1 family protein [Anaerolineae bacterium]